MYKRLDANHKSVKQALQRAGVRLRDFGFIHGAGFDLAAEHVKTGAPVFLEIKRPGPPSSVRLTESEEALRALFPGHYHVVQTEAEALAACGLAVQGHEREADQRR